MICPRKDCNHEWTPRVNNPVKCPYCQRPLPRAAKAAAKKAASNG
jgi:hypothetical protein